ncbi:MAG: mycofactocin precursor [Actinobacteria bacterium RBG_16_64_13]|nr:MAG: mycofactocin precursor [Actinobacteria bacterium RBG_16_64_13]
MELSHADALTDVPCPADEPAILEEIEVEDLAVDGICGVY